MNINIREHVEENEKKILAPYATFACNSKGRAFPTEPCTIRTEFQRDRDRILHCKTFRRLMHKTQVFLNPQGDHYRTRLTHTLEVGQIARTMACALSVNQDLTEAIALGHDLGHTPFGHAGEFALRECTPVHFVHSEQSVRVATTLENNGRGLNLTKEVLNGILCHSDKAPWANTPEGKLVRYADKFAYIHHDTQDAFRAGVLQETDIPLSLRELLGMDSEQRLNTMILSVIRNSIDGNIAMDPSIQTGYEELKTFMFANVYTNPTAKQEEEKAKSVIASIYKYYHQNPEKLPEKYHSIAKEEGEVRAIIDFISGMTDRYCVAHYSELFLPKQWGY